jgi:uncharacterized membrane protein YphA (DoxX/SURF4 family)
MTADLLLATRWLLALVLLTAASFKLFGQQQDQRIEAIRRYGIVPDGAVPLAAWGLPLSEATLGVGLAAGVLMSITAVLCGLLLAGFAGVMAWHLASGRQFDCGCGTRHQRDISWILVAGDAALALMALVVAVGPGGELAVYPGWALATTRSGPVAQTLAMPLLAVLVIASWPLLKLVPHRSALTWRQARRRTDATSVRPTEVR